MAAYLILTREEPIQDTEAMAEYQRMNRESANDFQQNYHLKPLVIYGKFETLEGEDPNGVLILEFPTVEEAKAWYNSPSYQAALPYRKKAANHRVIIVEGLPTNR